MNMNFIRIGIDGKDLFVLICSINRFLIIAILLSIRFD